MDDEGGADVPEVDDVDLEEGEISDEAPDAEEPQAKEPSAEAQPENLKSNGDVAADVHVNDVAAGAVSQQQHEADFGSGGKKRKHKSHKKKEHKEKRKAAAAAASYVDHDHMTEEYDDYMMADYDSQYASWYGQTSPRYDTPFSSPDRSPPVSYDDIDDTRPSRYYGGQQQQHQSGSESDGEESYYMQHTKRQRRNSGSYQETSKHRTMLSMIDDDQMDANVIAAEEKGKPGGGGKQRKEKQKQRDRERDRRRMRGGAAQQANGPPSRRRDVRGDSREPKPKPSSCRFYIDGRCSKGADCPFPHDGERVKRLELCKYYMTGGCSKIGTCTYMHSDFPCKFFHHRGSCHHGDSCRFSHNELTPNVKAIMEKRWEVEDRRGGGDDEEGAVRKKPSLLGTPPRLAQEQQRGHVPQEQTNAAPPTKIPSLFDIKVAPPKNFKLGRRGGSPGRSGNGRMGFYNESSPPPQRRPGLLGPAPPGVMSMQQQQQPNAGVRSVSEHNDVDLRQMQGPPSLGVMPANGESRGDTDERLLAGSRPPSDISGNAAGDSSVQTTQVAIKPKKEKGPNAFDSEEEEEDPASLMKNVFRNLDQQPQQQTAQHQPTFGQQHQPFSQQQQFPPVHQQPPSIFNAQLQPSQMTQPPVQQQQPQPLFASQGSASQQQTPQQGQYSQPPPQQPIFQQAPPNTHSQQLFPPHGQQAPNFRPPLSAATQSFSQPPPLQQPPFIGQLQAQVPPPMSQPPAQSSANMGATALGMDRPPPPLQPRPLVSNITQFPPPLTNSVLNVPPPALPVRPPWDATRLPPPLAAAVLSNLPLSFANAPPALGADPLRPPNLMSVPPPLSLPPGSAPLDAAGLARLAVAGRLGIGMDSMEHVMIKPEVVVEIDASFAKNGGMFYILKPLTFDLKKNLPPSVVPSDPKFKDDPRVKALASSLATRMALGDVEKQKDPRMQRGATAQKASAASVVSADDTNKSAKSPQQVFKADPRKAAIKVENPISKDNDGLSLAKAATASSDVARLSVTLPDIDFPIDGEMSRKSSTDLMYANILGGGEYYTPPAVNADKKVSAAVGMYGSVGYAKAEVPNELRNFVPPKPSDIFDVSLPAASDSILTRQNSGESQGADSLQSMDKPLLAHRSDPRFRKKQRSDSTAADTQTPAEIRPTLPKDLFTAMDPLFSPTETSSSLKDVFKTIDPTASPFC